MLSNDEFSAFFVYVYEEPTSLVFVRLSQRFFPSLSIVCAKGHFIGGFLFLSASVGN